MRHYHANVKLTAYHRLRNELKNSKRFVLLEYLFLAPQWKYLSEFSACNLQANRRLVSRLEKYEHGVASEPQGVSPAIVLSTMPEASTVGESIPAVGTDPRSQ